MIIVTGDKKFGRDLKEINISVIHVSFATVKAGSIRDACKIIVEKYNGKVPDTMKELLSLPVIVRAK